MKKIILLLFVSISMCIFGEKPFRNGEKAIYNAYWSGIKVGIVTLEVAEVEDKYQFTMTMNTTSLAEKFYSASQVLTSLTDKDLKQSFAYNQDGTEKGKKRQRNVEFDWANRKVRYIKNGKVDRELDAEDGMLDPLSVFYYFRMQDLHLGSEFVCKVTDGKNIITGSATVDKEEKINVKGIGRVNTYIVNPNIKGLGGIFGNSDDAKIEVWLSQGKSKLPVKIKSKVKVGSFTIRLTEVINAEI